MKKRFWSLVLVIAMIMSFMPVIAQAATSGTCGENLTWTLDDNGTLTISGTGEMEDYGYDDSPWYSERSSIKTVDIKDGTTKIGNYAFTYCTSLTSVDIPDSVLEIGESAFSHCSGLTSIDIPDGVTSIGDWTFSYCSGLTSIDIPNSVTTIGHCAFKACGLTSIDIPGNVKTIGESAFYACRDLTRVTMKQGVEMIGGAAFSYCSGLISVDIPSSVTTIGRDAFSHCEDLTRVTMKQGIEMIEPFAFGWCNSLTSIDIPDSVTTIDEQSFFNCPSLKSINVDNTNNVYSSIDGVLFNKSKTELICYPCGLSESYTVPNNVTTIGEYAFSCSGLTSIYIPNSVTVIGDGVFSFCLNLKDVYYTGTKSEWEAINMGSDNDILQNATIHYSAVIPTPKPTPIPTITATVIMLPTTETTYSFKVETEDACKDSYVYAAVYDENDVLISVNMVPLQLEGNTTVTVDRNGDEAKAKVFIWADTFQSVVDEAKEFDFIQGNE